MSELVLGLISDTQGRLRLDRLGPQLRTAFRDVDAIWHAGDWDDAGILDLLSDICPRVVVVGGNVSGAGHPLSHTEVLGGWRVGMTHILEEADPAWLGGLDIVIHGHSHRYADRRMTSGCRALNPGTATAPRFGQSERSVARLRLGTEALLERVMLT